MSIVIVEIKARCAHADQVRAYLRAGNARFVGEDHQVDTYFTVPTGRLKLREGSIENALIYYERQDQAGPKRSDVMLHRIGENDGLKQILLSIFDVLVRVEKRREIWFIENVKFHIDSVDGLGSFVEIEAICEDDSVSEDHLRIQCEAHLRGIGIGREELVTCSYSDLLMS